MSLKRVMSGGSKNRFSCHLRAATQIPVATGEHEYTKYGFKEVSARGTADIAQPDVGRVGGITEWIKVAHLAHMFNLPVAQHAYRSIQLHLACATPNLRIVEYLGRVEASDEIVYTEFAKPRDGLWSPDPNKPGLDRWHLVRQTLSWFLSQSVPFRLTTYT